MENVTFVVACKKFFGLLPDQKLIEFSLELKRLTREDREELCNLFPSVGYTITDK